MKKKYLIKMETIFVINAVLVFATIPLMSLSKDSVFMSVMSVITYVLLISLMIYSNYLLCVLYSHQVTVYEDIDHDDKFKQFNLSKSDIEMFTRKLYQMNEQISTIENLMTQNNALLLVQKNVLTVLKDYYVELENQPDRLHIANDLLNVYLPTLERLTQKYIKITNQSSRTKESRDAKTRCLEIIAECCDKIELSYQRFVAIDYKDLELEKEFIDSQQVY